MIRFVRPLIFILGCVSLALGIIGIFVPLLPTTPFLILTAWCFLKSSPKAHAWFYRQPYLAKIANDWNTHGAISGPAKIAATVMILISVLVIWLGSVIPALKIALTVFLSLVLLFILSRPSRKD